MADIVLAEYSGRTWLVQGEQHMDDLLANTLPPHVTTEVVSCESKSEIVTLWRNEAGPDEDPSAMWLIHPAIADRARNARRPQQTGHVVVFAQWSASLDDAAEEVLADAAAMAGREAGGHLIIARHAPADGPALLADLGNLRLGLIEARLVALGVDAGRLVRDVLKAETPDQMELVTLVMRPASEA